MEQKSTTRQRILNAAINIFSIKGYHDSRVDDIVEASNTSKGAVYFHFHSKQDIFLGLVDEFSNLLENRIITNIANQQGGINKVDAALQACIQVFGKYRNLAKIFLIQAVGLGSSFEAKRQQIHHRFITLVKSYLDEAVRDGDIPPIDTEVTAYAWMGAINEVVIHWVYDGNPSPNRSYTTLKILLLRSIGVQELKVNNHQDSR